MRLITDTFAFCRERVPRWNTISISGYHIREAGCTAAPGGRASRSPTASPTWRRRGTRGSTVDEFAPQLSFFFNAHNNLLEEVAKFRAARRMWARIMRERFAARDPRSLDAPLPRADRGEHAHRPAAREQHRARGRPGPRRGPRGLPVAAHELDGRGAVPAQRGSRCASRCAPSRSSRTSRGWPTPSIRSAAPYAVERLTRQIEEEAQAYIAKIDGLGGAVHAIAFMQREIQEAAYRYQQEVEAKARIVVGVNDFVDRRAAARRTSSRSTPRWARRLAERLEIAPRARGTPTRAARALEAMDRAARGARQPPRRPSSRPSRASVTLGEICHTLRAGVRCPPAVGRLLAARGG